MNKMVVIWMVLAVYFTVKSFKRPSYAVALYMMTFFAAPKFWWWGDLIENYRWNFYSGVLLIGALVITGAHHAITKEKPFSSNAVPFLMLMAVNALAVHLLLAVNPDSSVGWLIARLKFILLFFLLQYSIRDEEDYRIVAMAICMGMGYIGYEATINERGSFSGGRLEGIGAAGVTSSNQLASLLITGLPIAVTLLFTNVSKWTKGAVLAACGMTFNVILMCNSRGSFLGLILGGIVFLVIASGPARKQSNRIIGLALVATFLLLGDPKIINRFLTTFNSEGERDNSAESRILFWTSASRMIADYPFGSGGNSFSEGRGWQYMPKAAGKAAEPDEVADTRAIHNGWITEAVDWGVQGFALMALFIAATFRTILRGRALARDSLDVPAMMVFACLATGMTGWMVSSVFGDYLNDEWGFWITAMVYAYLRVRLFATEPATAATAAAQTTGMTPAPVWPRPLTP